MTFPNVLRPCTSLFRRWEDSTRSRQDAKGFLRHDGERQVTIRQSSIPHHLFFAVFLVAILVGIMFLASCPCRLHKEHTRESWQQRDSLFTVLDRQGQVLAEATRGTVS